MNAEKSVTFFPDTGEFIAGDFSRSKDVINGPVIARAIQRDPSKINPKSLYGSVYNFSDFEMSPELAQMVGRVKQGRRAAALIAASPGTGDAMNLTHLQQIFLQRTVGGDPTNYFYLGEAFDRVDVPMLELRETYANNPNNVEYTGRLEETEAVTKTYDELKWDLKKLTDSVYTPIEDIYRTVINPQTQAIKSILFGFNWKRNQLALQAIKQTVNSETNGTSITNIGNIDALGTNDDAVHSTKRIAREINDACNTFLKTNDVKATHIIGNPKFLSAYSENTWTGNNGPFGIQPIRLNGGGVVALPGLMGLTGVFDVHMPDNEIYLVNKQQHLGVGEGPKTTRKYFDERRNADGVKYIDFVQYLNKTEALESGSTKRKYGFKLIYSTNA